MNLSGRKTALKGQPQRQRYRVMYTYLSILYSSSFIRRYSWVFERQVAVYRRQWSVPLTVERITRGFGLFAHLYTQVLPSLSLSSLQRYSIFTKVSHLYRCLSSIHATLIYTHGSHLYTGLSSLQRCLIVRHCELYDSNASQPYTQVAIIF